VITYPVILVPDLVYTGNTLSFDVPSWSEHPDIDVSNIAFTVKWYARTRAALGATITGATEGSGWRITVPAATTATFVSGSWTWEIVATKTDGTEGTYTGGRGEFTVRTTASYSGTVNAYDNRSAAEITLGYVDEAIDTLSKGGLVQEYSIGGRSLRRYKMSELLQLKETLQNEINMEERKERMRQGLGNPGIAKVRFV
jgi:hypothetical protein